MLLGAFLLAGCSADTDQRTESFEFTGARLDVVNSNANMPVTTSDQAGGEEIVVTVHTETLVKSANTPAWSLDGTSLNLGTPCGDGIIGYCEGSFSIVVPAGTEVYVNGAAATTR
ncbi:hypothetical protein BJD99_01275 [Rhodococcus sp. 1163]|nr:hypothetical protein BJD99_01275 [Rhodococcus sp. 1163]